MTPPVRPHSIHLIDYAPARRMKLLFVTPAHRRYKLSGIVYAQRADCIRKLAEAGIESQCVVISDDENLKLAAREGFATINRNNASLGARFNDGYAYAAEHGYTHIAPIGSDSWVDPNYFLPAPKATSNAILTSVHYAIISEDGRNLAQLEVEPSGGVGPHTFATRLIAKAGNRPVEENLRRGCDHSLLTSIRRSSGQTITWEWRNQHPLQYIGYRSAEQQLNPYRPLRDRYAVEEHQDDFWDTLAQTYPAEIVEQARLYYASLPPRRTSPQERAAQRQAEREQRRAQRRNATQPGT